MHWENLFDDMENQLASEWEADRAALDAESERLRIARMTLAERLRALAGSAHILRVDLDGSEPLRGRLRDVGVDWATLDAERRLVIVPLPAIRGIGTELDALLASLDPAAPAPRMRDRMTLGFVLRDLARRRMPLHLCADGPGVLHGTLDRAGADHLDIALHEPNEPRRASAVRDYRMIPFGAVRWLAVAREAFIGATAKERESLVIGG